MNQSDFSLSLRLTAITTQLAEPQSRVRSAGGDAVESLVRITLNGEQKEVPGPLSVAELVRHLGLKAEHVAVELNKGLVTRSRQAETPVAEGDVLEVVTLVGGGAGAPQPSAAAQDRHALFPQPALCRHGQVHVARADARLPRGQRGGSRHGRRAARAAL